MNESCITKQYVLDPHHKDCPEEVTQEVMDLGRAFEMHNESFKVRGLLCFNCNRALGAFKDSEALLQKAIEYLKEKGE